MIYDGPRDVDELWETGNFSLRTAVKLRGSKTMRTRPSSPIGEQNSWHAIFLRWSISNRSARSMLWRGSAKDWEIGILRTARE